MTMTSQTSNRKTTQQGFQFDSSVSIPGQLVPIVPCAWLKTCLRNRVFNFIPSNSERRSSFADNVLFHHDGAKIVRAVPQRDLTNLRSLGYPGALDVFDIVQINPGQSLHPQVLGRANRNRLQNNVFWLERPANKGSKAIRLILHLAQPLEMLDPVFDRLNVAKHHR